jgi:hypothetical protein
MWNKEPKTKKDSSWQPNDRIAERQNKIYGMPYEFKGQVLDFERKFLEFHEVNEKEFGCRTYEAYLQHLGAITNLEGSTFSILNKGLYEDLQTLWDGLQEVRCRRKYAKECEETTLINNYVETEEQLLI